MFAGTEYAARRIWAVIPKRSYAGYVEVNR
jgi:hypothetical protein